MPPFVYRSLKDFMRASATAQTRQELLQKLITTAAKRKAQFHVDATDARLVTSPETFGMNLSKQIMNKQANMALLRQILSPAMKQLQTGAAKTMGGLKTYGKRLMGDSTVRPIRNRINVIKDVERDLAHNIPNPKNVAVNSLRYNPRAVGNPTQAVADARRARNIGFEAYKDLNTQSLDSYDALFKELEAIRRTRLYTGGAVSGATLGVIGDAALKNTAGTKQSMTMPQPSSRGQTKKVQMPEASLTKPDCDPEGVQMSNNKQAFMGLGALAGMATAPNKEEEDLSIGRGALRGAGTALGASAGAGIGGIGGAGIGAIGGGLLGALAGAFGKKPVGPGRHTLLPLGQRVANGAVAGGGLGALAGIPAGAIYGGIKGNKATKALLDKSAPISEKKKDKKDDKEDDKEVKEAAAVVLAQLKRNHNK